MTLGLGVPIYLASTGDSTKHPVTPISELIRSYIVYGMLCYPSLVEASPKILEVLTTIPGVKQITEAMVRATFFNQV
jgi:proline dehydrogenase